MKLGKIVKRVNNSLGIIKMGDKKTRYSIITSFLGILLFILIATISPFRTGIFSLLFPKNPSHAAVSTSTNDWPQIQHDALHTGTSINSVAPPYSVAWAWFDK